MDMSFHKNFREAPSRRMPARGRGRGFLPSDASQWIDFRERAFKVLLIVAPIFVFLMIVAWDWLSATVAPPAPKPIVAENPLMTLNEEEMRARVWPTSAEDIEAAQPEFGGKPIGDLVKLQFDRCGIGSRFTCVVDGDTIWYKGDRVRIADIDAPEVTNPECARELNIGEQATARLIELLNAGAFSLQTTDTEYDRYGRRLLKVTRNGQSIGNTLVREGLAERWGGPRIDWCSR